MTSEEARQLDIGEKLKFIGTITYPPRHIDYGVLLKVDKDTVQVRLFYNNGQGCSTCWYYCIDWELLSEFPEDDYDVFECK